MNVRPALASLRRARALVAVGVAAASLAATSAAGAQPVQPVNGSGKKSCGIETEFGTVWVEHGATIVDEGGRKQKCDDGKWIQIPTKRG